MLDQQLNIGHLINAIDVKETPCYKLESLFFDEPLDPLRKWPQKLCAISSGTNLLRPPSVILEALHQDSVRWDSINSYTSPLGNPILRGSVLLYEESLKGSELGNIDVAITVGGAEAVRLAFEYLKSLDIHQVLVAGPQYSVVYQALISCGMSFYELSSQHSNTFLPSPDEIEFALHTTNAEALFITEPNNPSGEQHSHQEFANILSVLEKRGTYLVLDKVCSDFAVCSSIEILNYGDVIDEFSYWNRTCIIDSLSKRRAISGLRFGYLIGAYPLINFVLARRIGGCPPNVATDGIVRDLFFSAHLHRRASNFLNAKDNAISSFLAKRLSSFCSGEISVMNLQNVYEIERYNSELRFMYQVILANKRTCSQQLKDWIVYETPLAAGFNYLICLRLSGRFDDDYHFAKKIFEEAGVGLYPISCFVTDSAVLIAKHMTGCIWLRISCAVRYETFLKTIEAIRLFLEQNLG